MNFPVICLCIACFLASLVNVGQDSKIKELTERVYKLEQSK